MSRHEPANLTRLSALVSEVEFRYARCYREVDNNRVIRRWRPYEGKDENDPHIIDVAGHRGRWLVFEIHSLFVHALAGRGHTY